MTNRSRAFLLIATALLYPSCAVLHHAQVGEVDSDPKYELKPFDLKVSETGFNIEEAGDIAKSLARSPKDDDKIGDIMGIIKLFQQGPTTGNPVFTDVYAKNVIKDVYKTCPSGRVTGLMSVRETRKYPVISGEIVKVTGFCMEPRTATKTTKTKKKSPTKKMETH